MRGVSRKVRLSHQRNGTTRKFASIIQQTAGLSAAFDGTYEILVGIHVDFETVFFTLAKNFDSIVHEFVVIFTTIVRRQCQHLFPI